MTGILGSLDPTQFWILVLTLWAGIVGMIGCTIWAVTRLERNPYDVLLLDQRLKPTEIFAPSQTLDDRFSIGYDGRGDRE